MPPLARYGHVGFDPPQPVRTKELVVIGVFDSKGAPAKSIGGLTLAARRQVQHIGIARYHSDKPVVLRRDQFAPAGSPLRRRACTSSRPAHTETTRASAGASTRHPRPARLSRRGFAPRGVSAATGHPQRVGQPCPRTQASARPRASGNLPEDCSTTRRRDLQGGRGRLETRARLSTPPAPTASQPELVPTVFHVRLLSVMQSW